MLALTSHYIELHSRSYDDDRAINWWTVLWLEMGNGVARNRPNVLSRCSRSIGYLLPIELRLLQEVCTAVCIVFIYSKVTFPCGSLVPICGFRARGEEKFERAGCDSSYFSTRVQELFRIPCPMLTRFSR